MVVVYSVARARSSMWGLEVAAADSSRCAGCASIQGPGIVIQDKNGKQSKLEFGDDLYKL